MPTDNQRLEALTTLFADLSARERALSERQYTVAVSLVTLNLAITAALITFPRTLTCPAKLLGVIAIWTFNLFAIWYINKKASAYWTVHDERTPLQAALMAIANPSGQEEAQEAGAVVPTVGSSSGSTNTGGSALTRGWMGSLAFVVAVLITAIVATIALLLQGQLTL